MCRSFFFFCHCSVAQDYSCCGAILPDDHPTPLSALVSQVAHRTYSFASLNLHRKTAGPGWPSPTKWIRGEWRRWRRIPRADIRKSPSPHNTLQILEGLSEGLPTCSTFTWECLKPSLQVFRSGLKEGWFRLWERSWNANFVLRPIFEPIISY